ncbi:hypothetical protein [Kitasatospora sp. NPDC088783]|uniref:hypothetical protein n=1 Tax=Kitasatospora sp. NPDC088783 TaxID=3364077 RepID=UPI00381AB5F0
MGSPRAGSSTAEFREQLRAHVRELDASAAEYRQAHDAAAARLADVETRLRYSSQTLLDLDRYTGIGNPEPGPVPAGTSERIGMEAAILAVLRSGRALRPAEVKQLLAAEGVYRPAGSVRARMSHLHTSGVLDRDDEGRYWIRRVSSGSRSTRT